MLIQLACSRPAGRRGCRWLASSRYLSASALSTLSVMSMRGLRNAATAS